MDAVVPGHVVLSCIIKQTDRLMGKQVSVPPRPLLQFLPPSACPDVSDGLLPRSIRLNMPFPPLVAFGHSLSHSNRNLSTIISLNNIYNLSPEQMLSVTREFGKPATYPL